MARALRIEYPVAVYHVMARGNQGDRIFKDDRDRRAVQSGRTEGLRDRLSACEYEVMTLIAEGTRQKEIAHKMNISIKTISSYRQRILDKLNLSSTAEMIPYLERNSQAQPDSLPQNILAVKF